MGCSFMGSSFRSASVYEPPRKPELGQKRNLLDKLMGREKDVNPNPENFDIVKALRIDNFLVVKINYPDCVNFEGNKILVYRNVSDIELMEAKIIDPHFFNAPGIKSPIARFVPTDEGWDMAVFFCRFYEERMK